MNKIPSVFLRNPENMQELTREVNPLCQWVLDGEGLPTRKYNGTAMFFDEQRKWWSRREVKEGKVAPEDFVRVEKDDFTGRVMGWVPTTPQGYGHPLLDALDAIDFAMTLSKKNPSLFAGIATDLSLYLDPGTYELCGPKIGGNPEKLEKHQLFRHADAEPFTQIEPAMLNSYDVIKATIIGLNAGSGWEGIVWHHPDGRMAKMKARDYRVEAE